jgi:hypothetical protein
LFDSNDILEREWWLMNHLKLGYQDIETIPWEEVEWFYNRHTQYLIDIQKEQNEKRNKFG